MEYKKNINNYSLSNCYYLGERNTNRFIYKYMNLEVAVMSLTNGTVRFVEPYTWQDKFEGRFYNASYAQVKGATGNTPPVLACCLTHAPVNEAAWKVYSSGERDWERAVYNLKLTRKRFVKQWQRAARDSACMKAK